MRQLATSIERDAWLSALVHAFDSAEVRCAPVSAHMIAELEKHLRENARLNASVSRLFH